MSICWRPFWRQSSPEPPIPTAFNNTVSDTGEWADEMQEWVLNEYIKNTERNEKAAK